MTIERPRYLPYGLIDLEIGPEHAWFSMIDHYFTVIDGKVSKKVEGPFPHIKMQAQITVHDYTMVVWFDLYGAPELEWRNNIVVGNLRGEVTRESGYVFKTRWRTSTDGNQVESVAIDNRKVSENCGE